MPVRHRQLTQRDIELLLSALDQIERFAWAARNVLLDIAPKSRIPGGPPCGLRALVESGKTECAIEYVRNGGGAQCGRLAKSVIPRARRR